MDLGLYAHPWDVAEQGAAAGATRLARWRELGFTEVALAASYHAGRWLMPRGPRLVRFLEDGVVHFRPTSGYGALKPLRSQEARARGPSPLQQFVRDARKTKLRSVAWTVLFHNTRLGELQPDACVTNVFGDRYPYALCPARAEVADYGAHLVADVARHRGLDAVELEAAGFFGWRHSSHHEKASFVPDADAEFLLSLCFCAACAAGIEAAGGDAARAADRVRAALRARFVQGDAISPAAATAVGAEQALGPRHLQAVLAHRREVVRGFLGRVRHALPRDVDLALHWVPDPRFSGSQVGLAPEDVVHLADEVIVSHYGEGPEAIARHWAKLGPLAVPARLAIWPKAPQFQSDDDLRQVAGIAERHGVRGLRVYHHSLLPDRTLERVATALRSVMACLLLVLALAAQTPRTSPPRTSPPTTSPPTAPTSATATPTASSPHATTASRPRLVVLLIVDQLATWVLEGAEPFFGDDGFARLRREGTYFTQCAYAHGCTVTGPGHATLGTGADARGHGIVSNTWNDPETGKQVNCVADEDVKVVGGAGGASASAHLLLAPTLGDGMKAHLGARAQVVSLSYKDRSSILMAGRAADAALWVEPNLGVFVTSTAYGSELPPWVASLNQGKPLDQFFGQVWERSGPEAAYAGLVDDVKYEGANLLGGRTLPQAITGGETRPGARFYAHLEQSPFMNDALLRVATTALDSLALGKDDVPDLLCISFSCNDAIGHLCGPHSVEVRDVTLQTDRQVAELLRVLDARVGRGRYLFLLSADHGIAPVPEAVKPLRVPAERAKTIVALQLAANAANTALVARLGKPASGRWAQPSLGGGILLARAALREKGHDLAQLRRVAAAAAAAVPGIARAVALDDLFLPGAHQDPIVRAMAHGAHPQRSSDVELMPDPYWIETAVAATHGSGYPYDREVPLFAMGPGIAAGHCCDAEVTPGLGVVLAARRIGIPKPPLAIDAIPAGVLVQGRR